MGKSNYVVLFVGEIIIIISSSSSVVVVVVVVVVMMVLLIYISVIFIFPPVSGDRATANDFIIISYYNNGIPSFFSLPRLISHTLYFNSGVWEKVSSVPQITGTIITIIAKSL